MTELWGEGVSFYMIFEKQPLNPTQLINCVCSSIGRISQNLQLTMKWKMSANVVRHVSPTVSPEISKISKVRIVVWVNVLGSLTQPDKPDTQKTATWTVSIGKQFLVIQLDLTDVDSKLDLHTYGEPYH